MSGTADLYLLPLVASGGVGIADVTLEPLEAEASGSTGGVGTADLALERLELIANAGGGELEPLVCSGQGLTGEIGTAALTLERLEIHAEVGGVAFLTLEPLAISATGLAGGVGTAQVRLQRLRIAGDGHSEGVGDIAGSLLPLQISANGITGGVGDADLRLRPLAISADGISGQIGWADITLPLLRFTGFGFENGIGSAVLTLPLLALEAWGGARADPVPTALVLNPRIRAVTTYDNSPFNSGCRAFGATLIACADGIVALTGDDDNGEPIAALLESGKSDLGSDRIKFVPYAYIGYEASGNLLLTVTTDDGESIQYALEPREDSNLGASRTKLARGVKGRFWQWLLENEDGARFDINDFTLVGEETPRGIR